MNCCTIDEIIEECEKLLGNSKKQVVYGDMMMWTKESSPDFDENNLSVPLIKIDNSPGKETGIFVFRSWIEEILHEAKVFASDRRER